MMMQKKKPLIWLVVSKISVTVSLRLKEQQTSLQVMECRRNLVGKIGENDDTIFQALVRKGKIQAIINTVGTKRTDDEDGEHIRTFSY